VSNDIEVFDPPTGTSTIVTILPEPRSGHIAAALLDGTVLIAGGATANAAPLADSGPLQFFDSRRVLPFQLRSARANASATTLLDGRVLVVGGSNRTAGPRVRRNLYPLLAEFLDGRD
jgi:hypothetical protein